MQSGKDLPNEKGQRGTPVTWRRAALFGLCPRCGERTLFETPAQFAMRCTSCDLPFAELERGGRIAGFITMVIAVVLIMIAVGIESAFRPPLLLQFAVWAPLTVIVVIGTLRVLKVLPAMEVYDERYGADGKRKDAET